MKRLWLPVWVTPRCLYALGGIAVLLAASPAWQAFIPLAIVLGAALLVGIILDAWFGPSRSALTVRRVVTKHFALRVSAEIMYDVENRSTQTVSFGIVETPVRTLRFIEDACGIARPNSRAHLVAPILPVARGSDTLGTLYVWYENRLGLLRRRVRIPGAQAIRVYPDLSAVERYGALHVRNRLIEAGLRKMRLRGAGTEFESLREWASGDAFRSIDWKATARRGKVMVAQHEVERSQNVMILLDCGRLMTPRLEDQRKFDFAVTAGLSIAAVAGLASDHVGIVAFAREILAARAPRATRASLAELSDMLYDIEPRFEESDYTKAFSYVRTHVHKRSLIVFFTDVIDPQAHSLVLAELVTLARRHIVVCAFMNDEAIETSLAHAPAETTENADEARIYQTAVALGLRSERRQAAALLNRRGIITIDVPARQLTTALIDEYLRVKQRGLL